MAKHDTQPVSVASAPAAQEQALAPAASGASLEEAVRTMIAGMATLTAVVGKQAANHDRLAGAIADIVGEQQVAARKERQQTENHERIKRETAKTTQQRTQEIADKLHPDGTRFSVALLAYRKVVNEMTGKSRMAHVIDRAFPRLEINAGSPEEAQARYQKLCGIVATEGQIKAVPAGQAQTKAPAIDENDNERLPDERLPDGMEVFSPTLHLDEKGMACR